MEEVKNIKVSKVVHKELKKYAAEKELLINVAANTILQSFLADNGYFDTKPKQKKK